MIRDQAEKSAPIRAENPLKCHGGMVPRTPARRLQAERMLRARRMRFRCAEQQMIAMRRVTVILSFISWSSGRKSRIARGMVHIEARWLASFLTLCGCPDRDRRNSTIPFGLMVEPGRSAVAQVAMVLGLARKEWRAPTEEPGGVLWVLGTDRRRSFGVKRCGWH